MPDGAFTPPGVYVGVFAYVTDRDGTDCGGAKRCRDDCQKKAQHKRLMSKEGEIR